MRAKNGTNEEFFIFLCLSFEKEHLRVYHQHTVRRSANGIKQHPRLVLRKPQRWLSKNDARRPITRQCILGVVQKNAIKQQVVSGGWEIDCGQLFVRSPPLLMLAFYVFFLIIDVICLLSNCYLCYHVGTIETLAREESSSFNAT